MLDPIYSLDELLPFPAGPVQPAMPFERVMPWVAPSAEAADEKPARRRRAKKPRKTN